MNMKRTILATALMGTVALGGAAQADDYVYSASRLLVSDLFLNIVPTSGSVTIPNFTFTTEANATLNGTTVSDVQTCSGSDCTPDAGDPVLTSVANQGSPPRSAGDFSLIGP